MEETRQWLEDVVQERKIIIAYYNGSVINSVYSVIIYIQSRLQYNYHKMDGRIVCEGREVRHKMKES